MKLSKRAFFLGLTGLAAAAIAQEAFPSRPITIVVPYPPVAPAMRRYE